MKLIVDSGGSKTDWCLIDGPEVINRFQTPGMHALMLTQEEMAGRIAAEVLPQIAEWADRITDVYFYGAGCVSPQVCGMVSDAIRTNLPGVHVEVATDLLGSARALCGHSPGIACILGTGSNSCYYDGERIVENISPLGFILGDEGSGAYLGKILVGDVLKRQLPDEICRKFLDEYKLDALQIIQRVYREPAPNRFLASLTPFLSANIEDPAVRSLVLRAFKAFFERNVCMYREYTHLKVYCVGSIAYFFLPLLTEAAAWYGYSIGGIQRTPMEGLIEYHK